MTKHSNIWAYGVHSFQTTIIINQENASQANLMKAVSQLRFLFPDEPNFCHIGKTKNKQQQQQQQNQCSSPTLCLLWNLMGMVSYFYMGYLKPNMVSSVVLMTNNNAWSYST